MIEKQMTSDGEETKKLYYEDSHRKEFKATVLSCEERLTAKGKKDGYAVVLDQTAFFPEGGGQFGDRGWIDDVEVYDTHEKGGVILHRGSRNDGDRKAGFCGAFFQNAGAFR